MYGSATNYTFVVLARMGQLRQAGRAPPPHAAPHAALHAAPHAARTPPARRPQRLRPAACQRDSAQGDVTTATSGNGTAYIEG